MGSLYKRGKVWWMKFYVDGRTVRKSTETKRLLEAKALLKLQEGEIAQGKQVIPQAGRLRFEELARDFLTDYQTNGKSSLDKAKRSVRHLARCFGGMPAVNITTDRVRAYIQDRQQDGISNAEINRELAALKHMFNLALRGERLHSKPYIPTLKESNIRKGFFEPEAFRAVLSELPEPLKPMATFAYFTGWRKGEILNLTWGQIDLSGGTVRLEPGTTKNEDGRLVVLPVELHTVLRELRTKSSSVERERGQIIP